MPQIAPPKCAAWSKNFQPNIQPAASNAMIDFIAYKNIFFLIINN